jgi:hypothetical protein
MTRSRLLVTALAASSDLADALAAASALPGAAVTAEVFEPAVANGLVTLDGAHVRFRHPLVRSAICQSAGASQLRAAHRALASVFADQPDRSVWHRAAAVVGTDEEVALALAEAAWRAEDRGALDVMCTAFERAAALTRDPA